MTNHFTSLTMDAIYQQQQQQLLHFPIPINIPAAAYLRHQSVLAPVSSCSSSFRPRLRASFRFSQRGITISCNDSRSLSSCFAGILDILASNKRGLSQRKHWQLNRRYNPLRCEMSATAPMSQGSDPDWSGDLATPSGPTFFARVRAFCFYFTTYIVAIPLFFIMLLIQPFVLVFDKHRRKAQHFINKIWANLTIFFFYKAEIEGLENLPGPDEPAVYVSNHQSFLDIYSLFLLGRPFKFISKTSNFLIPIIGWSMYLTGHVPLRRMDTKSQVECLRHCLNLIRKGVSVFFFPEGTRSRDGKMGQFKRGAFTIAAKEKVPVVPISLIGTGKLMPNGCEGTLRPGTVKVIVHPPIRGTNAEELCEQSSTVISKSLVQHGLGVH